MNIFSEYAEHVAKLTARAELGGVRFVFLQAPRRSVSCYDGSEEWAWHDYYTDHGGDEGHHSEEEI